MILRAGPRPDEAIAKSQGYGAVTRSVAGPMIGESAA